MFYFILQNFLIFLFSNCNGNEIFNSTALENTTLSPLLLPLLSSTLNPPSRNLSKFQPIDNITTILMSNYSSNQKNHISITESKNSNQSETNKINTRAIESNSTTTTTTTATTTEFDRVIISLADATYPIVKESKMDCCPDYEKYTVSLRRSNPLTSDLFIHVCTAALLTRNIVLCAAHCFYDKRGRFIDDPDYYRAVVGKSMRIPFTVGIVIREIVQHPEYIPYIRKNDIGLVKLDYNMPNSLEPLINKMNYNELTRRDNCSQIFLTSAVMGNDALQDGYKISIQKAEIMHWVVCMKLYEKWGVMIGRNQLCTKRYDDCISDGGSVLICNNQLSGLLSFRNNEKGFKFYSDILPDVFISTSKYQYFLRTKINEMNSLANKKIYKNSLKIIILFIIFVHVFNS